MKEKKYDDEHPNEIFANIISKQITKENLNNKIKVIVSNKEVSERLTELSNSNISYSSCIHSFH